LPLANPARSSIERSTSAAADKRRTAERIKVIVSIVARSYDGDGRQQVVDGGGRTLHGRLPILV